MILLMAIRFSHVLVIITVNCLFKGFNRNKDSGSNPIHYGCNAVLLNVQEQKRHEISETNTENETHMTRIIGSGGGNSFEHAVRISLVGDFKSAQCSGTIQNALHIITSARCIYKIDPSELIVTAGKFIFDMEQNRSVVSLEIHEDYDHNATLNDIALLKLNESLIFSNGLVMPITLGQPNLLNGTVTHSYITGFGLKKVAENKLVYPRGHTNCPAPIVDLKTCKDIYQKLGKRVNENQICAGVDDGQGPCKGDEGAPLALRVEYANTIWKIYVVGILSTYEGCGDGIPGIYTQFENYKSWIESKSG